MSVPSHAAAYCCNIRMEMGGITCEMECAPITRLSESGPMMSRNKRLGEFPGINRIQKLGDSGIVSN